MLAAGPRLGPYEIAALLGAGGMGQVYRARDTRLDRTVALKVPAADVAADPAFRERFEREGRAISGLDHAHICALYDVGTADSTDFLVMQFLAMLGSLDGGAPSRLLAVDSSVVFAPPGHCSTCRAGC